MIYFLIQIFIILAFSSILSFQDIKFGKITKGLVVFAILAEFVFQIVRVYTLHRSADFILNQMISAVVMMILFYVVLFVTKRKVGFCEVLFATFCGLCLHWKVLWICILSAVIFMVAYILIRHFVEKSEIKKMKIPFIPFLSAGLLTAYLIQEFALKL